MASKEHDDDGSDAERFWDERYRAASPCTTGRPGTALCRFTETLTAGRVLELGCGKGDDAIWLASHGWAVVAVEISRAAIGIAKANAERVGAAGRIKFEQHDLSRSFPQGRFDLVTASFLAATPREPVFRRAGEAVALGGHLLIIDHGSRLPWSSAPPDRRFPTAKETLAAIALNKGDWARIYVGAIERHATGPSGETAVVSDNIIFLKRL